MKTLLIASLLTAAVTLSAQIQTLRGKVEDVRGTTNQFFLDYRLGPSSLLRSHECTSATTA
jgi:predicted small secreted protein